MNIDWNILWATALTRATERSTWLGVIALLAAFGVVVQPEHVELICAFGSGLAGILLVATKDNKTITVNPVLTINTVMTEKVETTPEIAEIALTGARTKVIPL